MLGSIGFVGLLLKADMDNPRALYLLDYMASSWVYGGLEPPQMEGIAYGRNTSQGYNSLGTETGLRRID